MKWQTRIGLAGWLVLGCYLWITQPVLVAALLLWGMVAAMFVLAVVAIASRAKRKRW